VRSRSERLVQASRRERLVQAATLAALALLVRGLHFAEMRRSPLYDVLLGDAAAYDRWARRIAAGDWLGSGVFYQTPLYPYLLGALYRALAPDPWVVRGVQAAFGALACVLLARAGARLFSERVGWLAGLLLALYPPAIFFDGLLQKASLDLLLMSALVWAVAAVGHRPRAAGLLGAGALLGALALDRENSAALLPVMLAWVVWLSRPRGAARALALSAAFLLGMACVLLPVALRNRAVGGELVLTTSQMGANFYIGNHRGADGGYTPLRAGRGDAAFEGDDARRLAEDDLGRSLRPTEVSAYWLRRAWGDIRQAPGEWTRLLAWKALLTWNRVELVDVEAIATHERHSRPLAALGAGIHFGVVCPLAALGIFLTRSAWRRLWPLYAIEATLAAAVALFYVFARYRYPLVPIAVLFAAAGLVEAHRRLRGGGARDLALALGVGAAAAVFCNWPVRQLYADDAVTYYNAGSALLERGRPRDALALLEQARDADPEFPETYNNLGRALSELGDLDTARRHLERGVALAPRHALLRYNLAVVASRQGDAETTRSLLSEAVALDPLLAMAYGPLAQLEARAGDVEATVRHLRRAAELQPDSAVARADLGIGLLLEGRPRDAVVELRAALRLDPALAPARRQLAWTLATADDPGVRDGGEALALAEALCALPACGDPELLQTLAAAHAAAGGFAEAQAIAGRAAGLAREAGRSALAEQLERQRAVYLDGRALREAPVSPEPAPR
jgi:tetratricopeptide (TPR) repeat protein